MRGSNFNASYHSALEYVDRAMPIFLNKSASLVTRRFGPALATEPGNVSVQRYKKEIVGNIYKDGVPYFSLTSRNANGICESQVTLASHSSVHEAQKGPLKCASRLYAMYFWAPIQTIPSRMRIGQMRGEPVTSVRVENIDIICNLFMRKLLMIEGYSCTINKSIYTPGINVIMKGFSYLN
jgi:hypothetical protein